MQLKKVANSSSCQLRTTALDSLWEQITQVCWCFPFYWAGDCFASSRFGHGVNNSQCRAVTIVVVKFSECILLPWRRTWRCREEWSASPLEARQITCVNWDRAFVFAEASGCTVGPYFDIVLLVPVVSLQDSMESLRTCQASWLAGRVGNVGTEKKKHVSTCR